LQKAVVIVAGGVGSRMNAQVPKQFIKVNSKPLIVYTIAAFLKIEDWKFSEIVIVCHKSYTHHLEDILSYHFPNINFIIVEGGASRFQSCYNGLKAIPKSNDKLVAIHDAARPLISPQLIKTIYKVAAKHQSAVPVIQLKDSVRMLLKDATTSKIVDRNKLRLVQTPQCFLYTKLLHAYNNALTKNVSQFTDDASVWEASYQNVFLCEGDAKNIKVTEPFDLDLVNYYFSR